jgi:hypothetical protein
MLQRRFPLQATHNDVQIGTKGLQPASLPRGHKVCPWRDLDSVSSGLAPWKSRADRRGVGVANLDERSVNVYENKGTAWRNRPRGANVIENKRTYLSKAAKILKTL